MNPGIGMGTTNSILYGDIWNRMPIYAKILAYIIIAYAIFLFIKNVIWPRIIYLLTPTLTVKGKVINKDVENSNETKVRYYIYFQPNDGEPIDLRLSQKKYERTVLNSYGIVRFKGSRFISFKNEQV